MALLFLSNEILLDILRYFGASEFREDIGPLLVCKQWYNIAQTALLEDIVIDCDNVHRMPLGRHDFARELLPSKLTYLTIAVAEPDAYQHLPVEGSSRVETGKKRVVAFREQLPDIVCFLRTCNKLRTCTVLVGILPELEPSEAGIAGAKNYARWHHSLQDMFGTIGSRLTSLVMDNTGFGLEAYEQGAGHLTCLIICGLLPSLHRLRVRLRTICPELLDVGPSCRVLPSKELIINLGFWDARLAKHDSVRCCDSKRIRNVLDLREKMVTATKAMLPRCPALEVARVIMAYTYDSPDIEVLNCINDDRTVLDTRSDWDGEGSGEAYETPLAMAERVKVEYLIRRHGGSHGIDSDDSQRTVGRRGRP
ncbi:hypothetical protein LTS18_003408 [Coniosporium uncinatum]|uniref:Uncharacterized protein n=1 Tax=Coniosporium uncinatum TaxID=93489 RepID=A0ACC3D7A8_9PEZI|nr:hypothetical protein LTS18_003408 [Coniosporium uncinatum]